MEKKTFTEIPPNLKLLKDTIGFIWKTFASLLIPPPVFFKILSKQDRSSGQNTDHLFNMFPFQLAIPHQKIWIETISRQEITSVLFSKLGKYALLPPPQREEKKTEVVVQRNKPRRELIRDFIMYVAQEAF